MQAKRYGRAIGDTAERRSEWGPGAVSDLAHWASFPQESAAWISRTEGRFNSGLPIPIRARGASGSTAAALRKAAGSNPALPSIRTIGAEHLLSSSLFSPPQVRQPVKAALPAKGVPVKFRLGRYCEVEQLAARQPHPLEVTGSSPVFATSIPNGCLLFVSGMWSVQDREPRDVAPGVCRRRGRQYKNKKWRENYAAYHSIC